MNFILFYLQNLFNSICSDRVCSVEMMRLYGLRLDRFSLSNLIESTLTQLLSSFILQRHASNLFFPKSSSPTKNWPDKSFQVTFASSQMVNCLHPLKMMFLAIYTATAPRPNINTLALLCLLTAYIPIAPMYLLHLSLTLSSLISISFKFVQVFLSYPTSTSSNAIYFDYILTYLGLVYFFTVFVLMRSLDVGYGSLFNSIQSYLMAFQSIVLYQVLLFLNVVHQL